MSDLELWKCVCGHENTTGFCVNCGKKREEGEVEDKKDDIPVVVASSIAGAASVGKVDIPDELKANIQKQAEPAQPVFQPQPYQPQPQIQQPYQPVQQPYQPMQQPMQQPVQQQVFAPPTPPVQSQYQQQYQPQYTSVPQNSYVDEDELFEKRKKLSNRLSLISLILHVSYIIGSIVAGIIEYTIEYGASSDSFSAMQIFSSLAGGMFTASIVLMIIARVKCRKAKFAKVLMWVYIIEVAVLVVIVVVFILLMFFAIITCMSY